MHSNSLQQRFIYISVLLILTSKVVTSYKGLITKNETLYKPSDGVEILHVDNIDSMLYGNNKPWFIQFYYSTCGHCRSYLPHFKKFLRNVSRWRSVVNLGVINCIVRWNAGVCRKLHIKNVPHLRYFHENSKPDNEGIQMPSVNGTQQDVDTRKNLLKVLIEEQKNGRFKNGPSLKKKILQSSRDILPFTFVIFEDEYSNVGAEVLLDTNKNDNSYAIVIGLSESPLAKEIGIRRFPALVLHNCSSIFNILTPKIANRQNFVKVIDKYSFIGVSPTTPTTEIPTTTAFVEPIILGDDVLLDDLEASLLIILEGEITRFELIEAKQFDALLNFVDVVNDYFPFKANGKAFIRDLKNSLFKRKKLKKISGEHLEKLIQDLSNKHEPVWATPVSHVKCLGSQTHYRGYTCGVWQMFHTMTVLAAKNKRQTESQRVLNAMHGFIKHFFGCEECSNHFQKMAANLKLHEPKNNKDAVMWLWKAHNVVNKRLSGDATDDPVYPKKQFPVKQNCVSCKKNGNYVSDVVYKHLTKIYSKIKVNKSY